MVSGVSVAPESMMSDAGGSMRKVRLSGAVDWLSALFANIAASPTGAHSLVSSRSLCRTQRLLYRKSGRVQDGAARVGRDSDWIPEWGDFNRARATQETLAIRIGHSRTAGKRVR